MLAADLVGSQRPLVDEGSPTVSKRRLLLGLLLALALLPFGIPRAFAAAKTVYIPPSWASTGEVPWVAERTKESANFILLWGDRSGTDPKSAPSQYRFDPDDVLSQLENLYSFYVNTKAWEALPKDYQAAFEAAAAEANIDMMAEYDFKNPPALRRLVGNGVKLHAYSTELMKAAQDAAFDLYAEESAKNPAFRKLYDSWSKFRGEVTLWHRFAEHTYSSFVYNNPPKKAG